VPANGTPRRPLWSRVPSPSHSPLYPSFGCPETSRVCHDTPHPIRIRGACDPVSACSCPGLTDPHSGHRQLTCDYPPVGIRNGLQSLSAANDSCLLFPSFEGLVVNRNSSHSRDRTHVICRLCSPSCEGLTAVLPSPLRAPSTRCSVASASSFVLNVLQGAICCGRPSDCRGLVQALQCLSDPLHHVPKSRRPPGERLRGPSGLADPTQDG